MSSKKNLPIGNDDFRKLREKGSYYVDKTMMIKEFIELNDEVALIARPRRFGKTLNMTMIRDFFDITVNSREIFEGLAIMDTEYAGQMNTRPVICFTFKNCKGESSEELTVQLKRALLEEYVRFEKAFHGTLDKEAFSVKEFYKTYNTLMDRESSFIYLSGAIQDLTRVVEEFYDIKPVLLVDEYDQPIMSSYERGYHNLMGDFFSNLYGSAMKGNPFISQALLTGVQRVAKESIFSQFNNARVYTVLHKQYAPHFGFTETETEKIMTDYGLTLNQDVQKKYDGYCFGTIEMYNPWSVLNYIDMGVLDNYWVNTSSNYLVKEALKTADRKFWDDFEQLVSGREISVWLTLETSYVERNSNYSLWGLLVNSGYLTALQRVDANTAVVKIPNDEVMSEFQMLIAEISGIDGLELQQILDNQYYAGLSGEIICIGLAHDKKRCSMVHKILHV